MYRYEQPILVSDGTWEVLKGNTIKLNSRYNLDSIPLKVEEFKIGSPKTQIKVETDDSITFAYLKDNLEYSFIINGVKKDKERLGNVVLPLSEVKTIQIVFYHTFENGSLFSRLYREQIQTATYYVRDAEANLFKVKVPLTIEMFNSLTINDEIEVRRNKLYWPERGEPLFKK